jgi:hypothetical protein
LFDPVLLDRCLPVEMLRRSKQERAAVGMKSADSPAATQEAKEIGGLIDAWHRLYATEIERVYHNIEPLDLKNERLAQMLVPVQTVIKGSIGRSKIPEYREEVAKLLATLNDYAKAIDEQEEESLEIQVLTACKEIFRDKDFQTTQDLLQRLNEMLDASLTPEKLAVLLRPFRIKPEQKFMDGTNRRGYSKRFVEQAWNSYVPE